MVGRRTERGDMGLSWPELSVGMITALRRLIQIDRKIARTYTREDIATLVIGKLDRCHFKEVE